MNLLDYLDWRGDLSFDVSPFNEVDNLILCMTVNLDYSGIVPEEGPGVLITDAVNAYLEKFGEKGDRPGVLMPKEVWPMVRKMAASRRFESLRLSSYKSIIVDDINEQFAGLTLTMPGRFAYVSFQGTDDTIAGWKEDCCMAFTDEIPAQKDAAEYLTEAASRVSEPLYVGGHSKGGNLAVYAAAKVPNDVKKRILRVYSNDGPGFDRSFFETDEYMLIRNRVTLIMPKWSIIGAIFEQDCDQVVVECSRQGIMAHSGYTWEVLGTQFVRAASLVKSSRAFRLGMNRALRDLSREEKRAFTSNMFGALTVTGARTITDLTRLKPREVLRIGKEFRNHREILIVFSRIFQESAHEYRAVED
ncbi:MAG: DUF2974 domain-containing protein [Lachnospiraceae bacterium]|nr:DUF2974 domain-containing protein [Lachnospiraceae bacterium]